MDLNQEILSDIVIYMKYARYIPELQRRELWPEICGRYESMMVEKYPLLTGEIRENMQWVFPKKVRNKTQHLIISSVT